MKKKIFNYLAFIFLIFNSKAQNIGIQIKKKALLNIDKGALFYNSKNFLNKKGKVSIWGNLKVNGKFVNEPLFESKNSEEGDFTLKYESPRSYGQLILNENYSTKDPIKIEYSKSEIKNQNGSLGIPFLPFDENFDLNNLFGLESIFPYPESKKTDQQKKIRWTSIKNEKVDPSLFYGLNLNLYKKKETSFSSENNKILLSGIPFAKSIKISFKNQDSSNKTLENKSIDYGFFTFLGKGNFLLLANPFTSNIDLRKIKGIENILGFVIPKKIKKNKTMDFYSTSFVDGQATGDLQAMYLRPKEFVYIKLKNFSFSPDLEIGDKAKTFYYPTTNKYSENQNETYPKLCMELNKEARAYIFVSKNLENSNEELSPAEILKLDNNKDSSAIWSLKKEKNSKKELKLYVNVIDEKWESNPIDLVFYRGLEDEKSTSELKIIDEANCNCKDFYLKDLQENEIYKLRPNEKYEINLPNKGEELKNRYQLYYKKQSPPVSTFIEEIPKIKTEKENNFTKISLNENEIIINFPKNIKANYASLILFNELNQLLYKQEKINTNSLYKKTISVSLKGRIHVKIEFGENKKEQINKWFIPSKFMNLDQ